MPYKRFYRVKIFNAQWSRMFSGPEYVLVHVFWFKMHTSLLKSRQSRYAHNLTHTLIPLKYKCKKHFIKMLKDVGMVVPKSKGTRL